MPHTVETSVHLLNVVQRSCMNQRFTILIHQSKDLLSVFSSLMVVFRGPGNPVSYSNMWLSCCNSSCQSCSSKSSLQSWNWGLLWPWLICALLGNFSAWTYSTSVMMVCLSSIVNCPFLTISIAAHYFLQYCSLVLMGVVPQCVPALLCRQRVGRNPEKLKHL